MSKQKRADIQVFNNSCVFAHSLFVGIGLGSARFVLEKSYYQYRADSYNVAYYFSCAELFLECDNRNRTRQNEAADVIYRELYC